MEKEFLREFIEKFTSDEEQTQRFIAALKGGRNRALHNEVSEAVTLDDTWVTTLEGALHSVEQIVRNPRKFIADEELVVDVERARRTNAKTVRHLAVNTRNIRNIGADGEVMPKKLLTTESREELAIYENRVVCSLVTRVETFVEQRYREINQKMRMRYITNVGMKSDFRYGSSEIEVDLSVSVKEPPRDKVLLERNNELIARIETLRRRVRLIKNTDFFKELSKTKPVRPPIMKTNLLKMNVDYSNCYKLWLYVSSYRLIGYSVEIKDKNLPVSGDFYDDLTVIAGLSVQSLLSDGVLNRREYEDVPFKEPRALKLKTATDYKIVPSFRYDDKQAGEEAVNEYYFRQLKSALSKAVKQGEDRESKTLAIAFSKFFRAMQKINEEMYEEIIRTQSAHLDLTRKSALKKKEEAVQAQKLLLTRYRQLSKLKREDLEKTLKTEARALLKLEKLQAELNEEKGKQKLKRERQRKQKARAKRIAESKKQVADQHAKEYEEELRTREAEKAEVLRQEKERKREEARRRRELKKLEELKEKYENE